MRRSTQSRMSNPESVIQQLIEQIILEEEKKKKVLVYLNKIADELDVKERDINITKTAFVSSGMVASCLTLTGIAAAPFAFHACLVLGLAGIIIGVSCAAGGMVTSIVDMVINKKTLRNAQSVLDDYEHVVTEFLRLNERLQTFNTSEIHRFLKTNSNSYGNQRYRSILEIIKRGISLPENVLSAVVAVKAKHATVLDTLFAGMKRLKIGGLELCVLTVHVDLHALVTNSITIGKRSPSNTGQELRRIATYLKKGDAKLEKEQALFQLYRTTTKYDRVDWYLTRIKLMILLLQIKGTLIIIMGVLTAIFGFAFHNLIRYGVVLVILTGVVGLCIELYLQLEVSLTWTSAEEELNEIMDKTFGEKDKNGKHIYISVKDIYDTFMKSITCMKFPLANFHIFLILMVKLLLDELILDELILGYTFTGVSFFKLLGEVTTELFPQDESLILSKSSTELTGENVNYYGAIMYVITLPICLYVSYISVAEMCGRKKTLFREGVDTLIVNIRRDLQHFQGQN